MTSLRGKAVSAFSLAIILIASSCATALAGEHVIPVPSQDTEMNDAISKAQSSLSKFLKRYQNPHAGDRQFVIKVAIRDKKGIEHFWLSEIKVKKGKFVGTITNQPTLVNNVKYQQRYTFKRADISDWGYFANDKAYGYHTLKVLLNRMTPQEAAQYRAMMGWQ